MFFGMIRLFYLVFGASGGGFLVASAVEVILEYGDLVEGKDLRAKIAQVPRHPTTIGFLGFF